MEIDTSINKKEKKTKGGPGTSDSKSDGHGIDVIPTSDYKINAAGKKYRAHRIVFNKGEDDSKQGVTEHMKKSYTTFVELHTPELTEEQLLELELELHEVLGKDAKAGDWIHDFINSTNPQFKGKSVDKRKQMALAAYYANRNAMAESSEIEEMSGANINTKKLHQTLIKGGWKLTGSTGGHDKFTHPNSDEHIAVPRHNQLKAPLILSILKTAKTATKKTTDVSEAIELDKELDELNKDTLYSYSSKANKSQAKNYNDTIAGIKANDPAKANKAHAKFQKRDTGIERAQERLNKEGIDMNEDLHPRANDVLKHIDPIHHDKYKPDLQKGTAKKPGYTGSYSDRAAVLAAAERAGHTINNEEVTSTYHNVKRLSTGVLYTKQFDKDGTSKGTGGDAAAKAAGAPNRGRGRPKKDKFAESVEILLSLSEEHFDSMMEDGFDAFFEAFEQLDELSKTTLGSYAKQASHNATITRKIATDFENSSKRARNPARKNADDEIAQRFKAKSFRRQDGADKAIDRLTK
jgi:predicted RNA binding protein YcfA (HicA-like mRNA interferase family)